MLNQPVSNGGNSKPNADVVVVRLAIPDGVTCEIGDLVGFLWSSSVDSYQSFPATADNSARYYGIALQRGTNLSRVRVQVSGIAKAKVNTKNTNATPAYANVVQGAPLTANNTGSAPANEIMPGFCRPEAGDMIVAQVLAGEPNIVAGGGEVEELRNVMLFGMNPYPQP